MCCSCIEKFGLGVTRVRVIFVAINKLVCRFREIRKSLEDLLCDLEACQIMQTSSLPCMFCRNQPLVRSRHGPSLRFWLLLSTHVVYFPDRSLVAKEMAGVRSSRRERYPFELSDMRQALFGRLFR